MLQRSRVIGRHVFPVIDFRVAQCLSRGNCLGNVEPFDAIDFCHLAAGRPTRRLRPRNIVRVPDVDDLVARLPFFLDKFEWSGADRLFDLGKRIRLRQPVRHDERSRRVERGQGFEHGKRHPQLDAELSISDGLDRSRGREQRLTIGEIALSPSFERCDDVGGTHGLPIMKL